MGRFLSAYRRCADVHLPEESQNRICPSCSGKHITEDSQTGDVFCLDCGYVLAERVQERGPEWREFEGGEVSRGRVGPPITLMKPGLGLATVYTRKERSLARALKVISNLVQKLGIDRTTAEHAAYTYRRVVAKKLQVGRPLKSVAAAALYASCREADIPRTLNSVAEAAGLRKRNLARDYRFIIRGLEMRMPIVEPERHITKIASMLSIDERTKRRAYAILMQAKRNGFVAGKDPKGLAATALYLATQPLPKGQSQRDFAKAADITTVTLRNRARQLKKYLVLT